MHSVMGQRELCAFKCFAVLFRNVIDLSFSEKYSSLPTSHPNQGLRSLAPVSTVDLSIYLFVTAFLLSILNSRELPPPLKVTSPCLLSLEPGSYPGESHLGGISTIQFAFWITESRLGAKLSNPLYPVGAAPQLGQEESSFGLHFLMSIYYLYMCVCVCMYMVFFLSHWSVVCGCCSQPPPSHWHFQEKRGFLGE